MMRREVWSSALSRREEKTGCDDDDYDRDPPPGLGTLVVDTNGTRVRASIEGERVANVGRTNTAGYDLEPGIYRRIDGSDTDRSQGRRGHSEGRRTVMEVHSYLRRWPGHDVRMFFDRGGSVVEQGVGGPAAAAAAVWLQPLQPAGIRWRGARPRRSPGLPGMRGSRSRSVTRGSMPRSATVRTIPASAGHRGPRRWRLRLPGVSAAGNRGHGLPAGFRRDTCRG